MLGEFHYVQVNPVEQLYVVVNHVFEYVVDVIFLLFLHHHHHHLRNNYLGNQHEVLAHMTNNLNLYALFHEDLKK
jgi:hypothetical protein